MTVTESNISSSPNAFKPIYTYYKSLSYEEFNTYACKPLDMVPSEISTVLDPLHPEIYQQRHIGDLTVSTYTSDELDVVFDSFIQASTSPSTRTRQERNNSQLVQITLDSVPGLRIFPAFLPQDIQQQLVVDVIEEYLPPGQHRTNLHASYTVPDPFAMFSLPPSTKLSPLPADTPPPSAPASSSLPLSSARSRKLRWVTLGGQYNWTTKKYPTFKLGDPGFPAFPTSLSTLLSAYPPRPFSSEFDLRPITGEASIVNFYSAGDVLSPHQDVAELSSADLVSLSLGCEAVFLASLDRQRPSLQLRVRSGDLIVMSGPARAAWHGVSKIFSGTSPEYLVGHDYSEYASTSPDCQPFIHGRHLYADWIATKRININIRQMLPST
ncbi:uncharacterized protein V1516DRAFT_629628 [Lipomyces oligophaga]|uniref:uncharacterized protein n=1 Tax=Lipomyces oligophaga TaxID=45792 RepID=UPI0034CD1570